MGLFRTAARKIEGAFAEKEEKSQPTTVDVMDAMSAKEKEFYWKLYIEYVNLLLRSGGKQNDTLIYGAEARNRALDLVTQLILVDKGLERIQRETVRDKVEVLVTRGEVSGVVKRLMVDPGIDEAIGAETANLVLSSKEQIDEVCMRIRTKVLELYGIIDPDPMKFFLERRDEEKIEMLEERMLAQLGEGGGSAYRRQLKKFNADVRLDDAKHDKYKKIFS